MSLSNTSGIHPKGYRLLVLPEAVEEVTESGIVVSYGSLKEREELANTTALVIEVGDECWADNPSSWAQPGDRVIIGKYAGLFYAGKDDVKYRIINDTDVVATIDADVNLVDIHLKVKRV